MPTNTPDAPTSAQEAAYDAELVRRFNAGDESAFVEIMSRYRSKMFNIAFDLVHNHGDAEEIAQDTFIRAHRGLSRFRGDSSLATWLHRIAVNLSRNRYWYFFRRHRHDSLSLDYRVGGHLEATYADLIPTEGSNPADETVREEFAALVSAGMAKLDAEQRKILTLRTVANLAYEEIGQRLGIRSGTVKSRIARARDNLRKLIGQMCPEFAETEHGSDYFGSTRSNYSHLGRRVLQSP